jgi:serpin B
LFATDHNEFALALYAQLLERDRNLFFSPFSIRAALAMAYAGARGETAIQMAKALRFTTSIERLHALFAEMIWMVNGAGNGGYELAVANSLWRQDGAPLLVEFVDLITRNYRGEMHAVDFRRDTEHARATINEWVEKKTNRRIHDLISQGVLDGDTRLVAVNSVHFKGRWVLQFEVAATHEEPFYVEDGGEVRARMMRQCQQARYVQADGFQAVELDYHGGHLSLLVLLPDRKDGLGDLENRLSPRAFHDVVATMTVREVKVILPRFTMTSSSDISAELGALGMPLAFDGDRADFSGMNGHAPPHEDAISISAVCHQAFIEMNEQGTEAAAATGLLMVTGPGLEQPPPVPTFRADHPFLFAIRDRRSAAVLFLGRMANPTREN